MTPYLPFVVLFLGLVKGDLPPRGNLAGESAGTRLVFDATGSFKVVSFSDMHFGENSGDTPFATWGQQHDAATARVHSVILDKQKPNFVVFNGDLLTGESIRGGEHGVFLEMCFGPTVVRGIPFASSYGNHDNSGNVNHQILLSYEQSAHGALSHTRSDVGPAPYGHINYWVPVYANASATAPELIMWFLDSQGGIPGADDDWKRSSVDADTVPPWIKAEGAAMKAKWGRLPPSVFFMHIPFAVMVDLKQKDVDGNRDKDWSMKSVQLNDKPTLDAIASLGSETVLAVISGHLHGQSWCARDVGYERIALCFDGHSGYGGYITPSSMVRNGRVLAFNLTALRGDVPSVETFNAHEDGSERNRVTLGPDFMPDAEPGPLR